MSPEDIAAAFAVMGRADEHSYTMWMLHASLNFDVRDMPYIVNYRTRETIIRGHDGKQEFRVNTAKSTSSTFDPKTVLFEVITKDKLEPDTFRMTLEGKDDWAVSVNDNPPEVVKGQAFKELFLDWARQSMRRPLLAMFVMRVKNTIRPVPAPPGYGLL